MSDDRSIFSAAATEAWVLRLHRHAHEVDAARWDALLAQQDAPTPFMRHAYLAALEASGSATPEKGWQPVWFTLSAYADAQAPARDDAAPHDWVAACVVYVKSHSYGEYVFDWAWAQAYERHGLDYYPKAVIAVPFTPVPGSRLLAVDAAARLRLLQGVRQWCEQQGLSSLHVLFASEADLAAARTLGLQQRETVQFHWQAPAAAGATGFDAFLQTLRRDKRKKIQQERRRVREAGVRFRVLQGAAITEADWTFFYRCYTQTYWEHGHEPYLTRAFFTAMQREMPEAWLLFVAEQAGEDPTVAPTPIACSLIGLQHDADGRVTAAYGRYWGALARVDALHFEACYYQPIAWCLAHGVSRFEGGAQGEHKMARALMPVRTHSAHWLAHPDFAQAVAQFLAREAAGVAHYLDELQARSPFKPLI